VTKGVPVFKSWGRVVASIPDLVSPLKSSLDSPFDGPSALSSDRSWLAYGKGRSYGDVCLNSGGGLILTKAADRILAFDEHTGIIRCESGISLGQILAFAIPKGWFLPVTPGTMEISLGGAIANDVHGKNHHRHGTIGRFVPRFELLRSSGERVVCTSSENKELYAASIGGMGLTGLLTTIDLQLKKAYASINAEAIRFKGLDEFYAITRESDKDFEYTVAWIDCVDALGSSWGRGVFYRGNHVIQQPTLEDQQWRMKRKIPVPFEAPSGLLNRWSVKAFNMLYDAKHIPQKRSYISEFKPFFYPLDSLANWNLIYGKGGLYQFQFVVAENEKDALEEIFKTLARSGQASFLAVLKQFGSIPSPGIMSFPRPGYTLTLDFPNRGELTSDLLRRLTDIVVEAKGRLYPAKDGHMSKDNFKAFYPELTEFTKYIDPNFSSDFWRRVS